LQDFEKGVAFLIEGGGTDLASLIEESNGKEPALALAVAPGLDI